MPVPTPFDICVDLPAAVEHLSDKRGPKPLSGVLRAAELYVSGRLSRRWTGQRRVSRVSGDGGPRSARRLLAQAAFAEETGDVPQHDEPVSWRHRGDAKGRACKLLRVSG